MKSTESTRKRLHERRPKSAVLILLLMATLLLMGALRTCSSPRPDEADTSRLPSGGDTLDVAIEYSPLGIMRRGDTLAGFGYEMVRAVAGGRPIKIHPVVALRTTLAEMRKGRYDLVIAQVPMTADFKKLYRLTEPVCIDRQVLVQRRDSAGRVAVASQLDLGGKRVSVVAGSPAAERLGSLSREIGESIDIDEDTLYSQEQLYLLVVAGDRPFAVVNASLASFLSKADDHVDISRGVSFSQFQSWIVNAADTAVANSLDRDIRAFRQTPAYSRLISAYGLTAP